MRKQPKRPRDANQLAKFVIDHATGQLPHEPEEPPKSEASQAAAILSQRGASKGGKARVANLSAKRRKAIAKKAAAARWKHK
jgi:hypothetical protein